MTGFQLRALGLGWIILTSACTHSGDGAAEKESADTQAKPIRKSVVPKNNMTPLKAPNIKNLVKLNGASNRPRVMYATFRIATCPGGDCIPCGNGMLTPQILDLLKKAPSKIFSPTERLILNRLDAEYTKRPPNVRAGRNRVDFGLKKRAFTGSQAQGCTGEPEVQIRYEYPEVYDPPRACRDNACCKDRAHQEPGKTYYENGCRCQAC